MTRPRPPDRIASSLSKSISGRVLHEPLYMSVGAAILCRFGPTVGEEDMDKSQLVRFARLGAVARLAEIEQERQAILRAFPDLRRARPEASEAAAQTAATTRGKRGARSAMSAAQRKAVSERMRKYWAARRGDSAQKQTGKSAAKSAAKSAKTSAPLGRCPQRPGDGSPPRRRLDGRSGERRRGRRRPWLKGRSLCRDWQQLETVTRREQG